MSRLKFSSVEQALVDYPSLKKVKKSIDDLPELGIVLLRHCAKINRGRVFQHSWQVRFKNTGEDRSMTNAEITRHIAIRKDAKRSNEIRIEKMKEFSTDELRGMLGYLNHMFVKFHETIAFSKFDLEMEIDRRETELLKTT